MKIIVSHDVDHLYLGEHWADTYLPGVVLRTLRDLAGRRISPLAAAKRFGWQLNRIGPLHSYNQSMGIPATYFFGMRPGLNLSYSWRRAAVLIRRLHAAGVDIGLHGMAFDDRDQLREEKRRLEDVLGQEVLGIRNHYLRMSERTMDYMQDAGFRYDSTQLALRPPVRIGSLIEFPISLMDVELRRLASQDVGSYCQETWTRIEKAQQRGLPYFVINFHDLYFSDGWPPMEHWYRVVTAELLQRGYEFTTFRSELSAAETAAADPADYRNDG
ncbi:MAG: hypothetical protein KF752_04345 [Pirellulaceae bacterium]|nr:hypothetical protein [Pirellulaceae bacterium]